MDTGREGHTHDHFSQYICSDLHPCQSISEALWVWIVGSQDAWYLHDVEKEVHDSVNEQRQYYEDNGEVEGEFLPASMSIEQ